MLSSSKHKHKPLRISSSKHKHKLLPTNSSMRCPLLPLLRRNRLCTRKSPPRSLVHNRSLATLLPKRNPSLATLLPKRNLSLATLLLSSIPLSLSRFKRTLDILRKQALFPSPSHTLLSK
jgi:hypothetical protein